jgi:hypothetical protein
VPVTDAVPLVRDGQVVQQCADCAAGRSSLVVLNDEPAPPPVINRGRAPLLAFVAVLLAFVAAPTFMEISSTPLDLEVTVDDVVEREHRAQIEARDEALLFQDYMANDPRPVNWHHPLAGDMRLPRSPSRRFGASRPHGEKRRECGRGHCGVDLGHLRGEVVHAAGDGIIDRIVRSDDEIGGRYVRIRHSSGFTTFYMHLGRIHPELEVGDDIRAGAPLGKVGTSGITYSAPHLHFAVRQVQSDGTELFVDPEPLLRKATVRATEAPFPGRDQI